MFSGIEPRAVGSILVLVALVGGLGYGGWSILQEVFHTCHWHQPWRLPQLQQKRFPNRSK
jgi:hypothetical protein